MIIVVRNDLGMSVGKIGAQVGHAVQKCCNRKANLSQLVDERGGPKEVERVKNR